MKHPASALDPAADSGAALLDQLGNALYVGGAIIFGVVMALAIYGVVGKARQVNSQRWILGGGLAFPIVTLTALLMYSLAVGNGLNAIGSANALQLFLECFGIGNASGRGPRDGVLRIHVVGKQWWWEVRYEQPADADPVVLANEIRMPTNRAVELVLSTTDVIHSFWAPSLAGKVDMIPGHVNRLRLQADAPGRFRGQCAEFCGAQHAKMMFDVLALEPAAFQSWMAAQRRPAREPGQARLQVGKQLFMQACAQCHAIRGTAAAGVLGPDLTHIGSRLSLASGTLPNNVGTLAAWIAGSQHIKPGNQMPSFNQLSGAGLRAVAQYMESLQ